MYLKFAFLQLKQKKKDFLLVLLFFSFAISFFYLFQTIEEQISFLDLSSNLQKFSSVLEDCLTFLNIFSFFLFSFLFLSASSLIFKRQKKDFGICLALGMSKKQIKRILFFELFLLTCVSFFLGLGLGLLLSRGIVLLLSFLFDQSIKEPFVFLSFLSIKKTIFSLFLLFLFLWLYLKRLVKKFSYKDFLYPKEKKKKKKDSIFSCFLFVLSLFFLLFSYLPLTVGFSKIESFSDLFWYFGLLIFGTFLFFYSVPICFSFLFSKKKTWYLKDLNFFTFRQWEQKNNRMVLTMGFLCFLFAIPLALVPSTLQLKNIFEENAKTYAPVDLEISKLYSLENPENKGIVNDLKQAKISRNLFSDVFSFDSYQSFEYPKVFFLAYEDYQTLTKFYHLPKVELKEKEYAFVSNVVGSSSNLSIPSYQEKKVEGFLFLSIGASNPGFYVMRKEDMKDFVLFKNHLVANYKASSEKEKRRVEERFLKSIKEDSLFIHTKLSLQEAGIGTSALLNFFALYLGILFLLFGIGLMFLKEISSVYEEEEEYVRLSLLKTPESMIKKSLRKQTMFLYGLPFLFSIAYAVILYSFFKLVLDVFGHPQNQFGICFVFLFLYFGCACFSYFWEIQMLGKKRKKV